MMLAPDSQLPHRFSRRQFLAGSAAAAAAAAAFACAPSTPAAAPRARPAPSLLDRSAEATVFIGAAQGRGPASGGVPSAGGGTDPRSLCHCPLSLYDHQSNVRPMLAERLPSVSDGTWVVNPDGSMRLTWSLRPNVRWHDGQLFTSKDIRFSWEFASDSALPIERNPILRSITAIDTPDDHTAVMHWRTTNNLANAITLTEMFVFPEHIIRPLWEAGDPDRIFSHPYFHDQFVGLGAYRMERRNIDETIVFKPFDDSFLARPRIGTIVTQEFENSLGLVTALLAGTVHLTGSLSLRFEDAVIAREQWEARGEGKVYFTPVGFMRLILQPRNPLFQDVRVRRALLHAIDRDELIQTFFRGNTPMAHTLLHPNETGYGEADRVTAKYPFDPRRALALFEEAGWRRGTDGVLANSAGDRFEISYRVSLSDAEKIRIQETIANYWRDIGVRTVIDNVSDNVLADREARALYPGIIVTDAGTAIASLYRRWHSSTIPREETRWTGDNTAQWNNPEADRALEQLVTTVDSQQWGPILVHLAQLYAEDLPALPLYFSTEAIAIHKNVRNARPRPNSGGQNTSYWNAYDWEWADSGQ